MRKEKRWVYYCDHCPKSGRSSGAMKRHEEICFANPERLCVLHRNTDTTQQPLAPIIAAIAARDLEGAKVAADGCPACVVAAITQERKQRTDSTRAEDPGDFWNYNYQFERDAWLNEHYADY